MDVMHGLRDDDSVAWWRICTVQELCNRTGEQPPVLPAYFNNVRQMLYLPCVLHTHASARVAATPCRAVAQLGAPGDQLNMAAVHGNVRSNLHSCLMPIEAAKTCMQTFHPGSLRCNNTYHDPLYMDSRLTAMMQNSRLQSYMDSRIMNSCRQMY
eukprot:364558-Chlamydomonas_euryale.AAC.8